MVEYPQHMVFSISSGKALRLHFEMLLAELGRWAKESLSTSENREDGTVHVAIGVEDVRRSLQGDPEAYRRLIERHQEYIGRLLWRFSRDRRVHEELVQDVFVEAYLSLGRYRGKAPFVNWLSRIATRVGYRYWKQVNRRKKRESFTLEEWDQLPGDSVEKMDASQAAALVHRLLGQLPPRDRLVLTLRYLEECDVSETAQRTGWTKGMVKVQTWRARKKLEKLFTEAEKESIL
jgi:RNA polymerase sigma-70 factor (ECF subfamily)